MIKLIASDLDGTLVKDGYHTLDPRVNELILELKDKGILFIAASGRQYPSMKRLFRDVKDEVIFIAENGAYIVCRGTRLYECTMNQTLTTQLIKEIRALGDDNFITVSEKDKLYIESDNKDFQDLLLNGYKNDIVIVDDLLAEDLDILNVSIYKEKGIDKVAKTLIPEWEDKLKVSLAGGRWLDFMDLTVDKGNAIAIIQEELQVGIDETIVFGDNINDIGMFSRAKDSYAVANARPEVKEAAKHIIDTNTNGGVIKILETLVD